MRFEGKQDEANRAALSFDGTEEAFALQRERAGVVVSLAMDEQNGRLDFVSVRERGHLEVDPGRLPVGSFLVLESERGERAVVGSAARDAGFEEIAVGKQVR